MTGFVLSHFAHNQVEMMVTLPMSFWIVHDFGSDLFPQWLRKWPRLWEQCCSLEAYVGSLPFWERWRGSLSNGPALALLVNLIVLALGIGVAWVYRKGIALIPIAISLTYSFSTAVGRYSGWRLILPADWVVFVFYALGLGQMVLWALRYYSGDEIRPQPAAGKKPPPKKRSLGFSRGDVILPVGLLILGFSPLLIEAWIPARYNGVSEAEAKAVYMESKFYEDEIFTWEQFVDDPSTVVLAGRALYPRYYRAGTGEPGEEWPAFIERDFNRLGFYLLGPEPRNVVLPLEEPPDVFPNASDVILLGCQSEEYVEAIVIFIQGEEEHVLERASVRESACPLLNP